MVKKSIVREIMSHDLLTQIETKLYQARMRGLNPVAIVLSRRMKSEMIEFFDATAESEETELFGIGMEYKGLPIIASDYLKNQEEPYVAC